MKRNTNLRPWATFAATTAFALAAAVRWEGTPQVSQGNAKARAILAEVNVTSFTVEPPGYARAGSTINFLLRGTARGSAAVQIVGVTDVILMRETSPGVYKASYTVLNSVGRRINVREGSAVARLRVRTNEKLVQASTPVAIDTLPPIIREASPPSEGRFTNNRPTFTASFDDFNGSGVDLERVVMTLDGREVTRDATVTSTFLTYRPSGTLSPGRHEVTIAARDRAGNVASKAYSFVVAPDARAIRSLSHTGANNAEPGTALRVVLLGEPGGRAGFNIGNRVLDVRMREETAGRYVGEYTVRRGDDFRNDIITVRLRTRMGEIFTAEAGQGLGVHTGPPVAPTISAPAEGTAIGNKGFVVRGTAERRVRVRVTYSSPVFPSAGNLYDQIVETDDGGNYATGTIDPNFLGADKDAAYTVVVTTVGANDTESEAATLTLKR